MALPDISLAQFNRIATGSYNAGQIDFKTNASGQAELVKINNHVWQTSKNNVMLSPERVLEVKEAFLHALEAAKVPKENMDKIRERLGLPAEMDVANDRIGRAEVLKARYMPLSRALVRELLDKYARSGKGYTQESMQNFSYDDFQAAEKTARMSKSSKLTRDRTNFVVDGQYRARGDIAGTDHTIADAISLLSTTRDLEDFETARNKRLTGENAVNDKERQHTNLVNSFQSLVATALKMLPANVRESQEFRLAGETVKLVKDDNGSLHAIIGKGSLATRVNLKMDAETFTMRLMGRAVVNAKTIGQSALKNVLGMVYDNDLEGGLLASERTSLTRQFSALILAEKAGYTFNLNELVNGNYNTGILEEMAERAIGGENLGDSKAMLDAYHAKLYNDNSSLPEEMKTMLGNVANIPLEKPSSRDGEFVVRAPIVGDINKVVEAMPPQEPVQVPKALGDIGGLDGVKNFVANLVFSDDTMVADSIIGKAGESMRSILTNDKNIVALAEIIKNPALLKTAAAPQIADVIAEGFKSMTKIIDKAFKEATGKTLADAAKEPDFVSQLSAFLKDPEKMRGADLAGFDSIILSMASKGCEKIQEFINKDVFKVVGANVNAQGSLVNEPYKDLSPDEIGKQLKNKSLNDILDTASNSDAPGQVGFFRQVISTYFTSLGKADKRSCFSAALKYADTFNFGDLKDKELDSAKAKAINKFTGAILKGTSPLLQKMMQGLPKDIMGDYADALDDMKSSLAPIPRKIVQAHFMQIIKDSKGKEPEIESIELEKSLGAASVGEAFLCSFKLKGDKQPQKCVVKIMRHDAQRRVEAESQIFTAAAKSIGPGMAKTWEGQLKQYMTEFDFTNEAKNVEEGVKLYDIASKEKHPLKLISKNVTTMKLSPIVQPKKDVMVAEVAPGKPVDKFFKENVEGIRKAASAIFEQDPATGRIKWADGPVDPKTGKAKKVPILKQNVTGGAVNNMIEWSLTNYSKIKEAQQKLVQATRVWFHEALLGSGKFHADAHSGNLMISPGPITFIDFGNLYELKSDAPLLDEAGKPVIDPETNKPKTVNERHELLRVIMGAAFRDKTFILDGLQKLLSPAGKVALRVNYDKAAKILDTILGKGRFSYDMVYRLNAAVTELQKLGIELPPQINCFVQSMARLSNTLTEMNTIVNQTSILLQAADDYVNPNPAPQRDELDIFGMAFDYRTSAEGRIKVEDDVDAAELEMGGKSVQISSFLHRLADDVGFGGFPLQGSKSLLAPGPYHQKVLDRLTNAADPLAEARKLNGLLHGSLDLEHNKNIAVQVETLDKDGITALQSALEKAGDDAEAKAKAIKTFASLYTTIANTIKNGIQQNEQQFLEMRLRELSAKPASFANAVMTTLLDNFDALSTTFADSRARLITDVYTITTGELKAGFFASQETRERIIKEDALKMAGDDSYQIDIGV